MAPSLKFIVPSAAGVFLFLTPVSFDGKSTIPIAAIVGELQGVGEHTLLAVLVAFCVLTAVLNVLYTYLRPTWLPRTPVLESTFVASPFWFWTRMAGAIFGVMYYFR